MTRTARQLGPRAIASFLARIDRSAGLFECWVWLGPRNRGGYGTVGGGRGSSPLTAHRAAWTLANGPIPPGLQVLHHCDNRPCCNPAHLYVGTDSDNKADMVRRGRSPRVLGEHNGQSRLTEAEIRAIRLRYAEGGITHLVLGSQYGIAKQTVSDIIRRKRWPHVA